MRWLLVALMASGCGFTIDMGGSAVGDDGVDPVQPDAGITTPPRMCSTGDPSLQLCIDFDDTTNLATDLLGHAVDADGLTPIMRATDEKAISVDSASRLHVLETPDLDIRDNITVSMWMSVDTGGLPATGTSSRWLYDNNTQYFAQLRVGGTIRCGVGGEDADSSPIIADGRWHHVACTYTRNEIRVYVDGHLEDCESTANRDIPTGGNEGLAIGANVASSPQGPKFTEQFIGGLDNVQVFSRLLDPIEICDAANGTICRAACPD